MKKINNVDNSFNIYKKFVQDNGFEETINNTLNTANIESINIAVKGISVLFATPEEIKTIAQKFSNTPFGTFLIETKNNFLKKYTIKQYEEFDELKENSFKTLKDVFKTLYEKLTDKNNGIAYSTIKALGIRACPYCNLNYIDPVIREGDGDNIVRHHLDHFYPKKIFPFLAVSFYNLIPSCYECNSGLKKEQVDFDLYNPYLDDFDNDAKFVIFPNGDGSISSLFNDINSFDINIKSRSPSHVIVDKISKYINLFCLKDRYKYRKEEAREILCHKALATTTYIKEVRRLLELNDFSDEKIKSILLMNYLKKEDINKRPLSKLTQDINLIPPR